MITFLLFYKVAWRSSRFASNYYLKGRNYCGRNYWGRNFCV